MNIFHLKNSPVRQTISSNWSAVVCQHILRLSHPVNHDTPAAMDSTRFKERALFPCEKETCLAWHTLSKEELHDYHMQHRRAYHTVTSDVRGNPIEVATQWEEYDASSVIVPKPLYIFEDRDECIILNTRSRNVRQPKPSVTALRYKRNLIEQGLRKSPLRLCVDLSNVRPEDASSTEAQDEYPTTSSSSASSSEDDDEVLLIASASGRPRISREYILDIIPETDESDAARYEGPVVSTFSSSSSSRELQEALATMDLVQRPGRSQAQKLDVIPEESDSEPAQYGDPTQSISSTLSSCKEDDDGYCADDGGQRVSTDASLRFYEALKA